MAIKTCIAAAILFISFVSGGDAVASPLLTSVAVEYPDRPSPVPWKKIKLKTGNQRLIAAALTLALGPFGAHRIYLGSNHIVPIAYVLTLGGGLGLVPLIDLGFILFSPDLERFRDNERFFMFLE